MKRSSSLLLGRWTISSHGIRRRYDLLQYHGSNSNSNSNNRIPSNTIINRFAATTDGGLVLNQRQRSFGACSAGGSGSSSSTNEAKVEPSMSSSASSASSSSSASSASSSSWWIGGTSTSTVMNNNTEPAAAAATIVSAQLPQQPTTSNANANASSASSAILKMKTPMQAFPTSGPPRRSVPSHIPRPPYAATGFVSSLSSHHHEHYIYLHNDDESIAKMRHAAQLACRALHLACNTAATIAATTAFLQPSLSSLSSLSSSGVVAAAAATVGGMTTTDDIDALVHDFLVQHGAYPSPLNYSGFPKSLCSSINEVICHGIPDTRPLQFGDVVSFDVSCFVNGVHGDNCATIIVGDYNQKHNKGAAATATAATATAAGGDGGGDGGVDWRGVPYKTDFTDVIANYYYNNNNNTDTQQLAQQQEQLAAIQAQLESSRRLVRATRESLYAAIETCRPGSCLSHIGAAIETIAHDYGYSSVRKYRGHGINHEFHCAPFVKHYKNDDKLALQKGMIFTIEPMLVANPESADCYEWACDDWTVVTHDGSCAAQFEHTILITENGHEILTQLPDDEE